MQTQQLVAQGRLPAAHSLRTNPAGQTAQISISGPSPIGGMPGAGGNVGIGVGGPGGASCIDQSNGGPCLPTSQLCTDPTGSICSASMTMPMTGTGVGGVGVGGIAGTQATQQQLNAQAASNQNQFNNQFNTMVMWGVGGLVVVGGGVALYMATKKTPRANPRKGRKHRRAHRRSRK